VSALLGAWSASGARAGETPGLREMRAQTDCVSRPREERSGRTYWISAEAGKLAGDGVACAAYEGFIVPGTFNAGEPRLPPEGHYVLAHASASGLTLMRALSGGERLYYCERDGVVYFACTLRALLALPGVERRLDPRKLRQAIRAGLAFSGDGSLVEGVSEVPAGHAVRFDAAGVSRRWAFGGLLTPLEGDPETLATAYREALLRAIIDCAGTARPVAVTLSGGIDSAAIAALAVEAFGADAVEAFTYEFDDPAHGSETPYAVAVCRHLGIRRHRVFRLPFERFLEAIPETVWRAESSVHWPKAFMLLATRQIRDAGHDRYLCGFGIGSHMDYYEEVARLLAWAPAGAVRAYWRLAHSRGFRWLEAMERCHPALAKPNVRLLHFLNRLLRRGPDEHLRGMPLVDQIRHQSFAHLLSCVDVTRWEKPLREIGAMRLSPAHLAATLPYAYLPYHPKAALWSAERALRPGKHLLRIAMRGRIPEAVIRRRKSWADAVASPRWLAAGRRWMRQSGADPRRVLDPGIAADPQGVARLDARAPQHALTALAFWHRLFIDRAPSASPPTWESLADA